MFQTFGSLYIDGSPAKPGAPYPDGARIGFGAAVPGFELLWRPLPDTDSFVLAQPALVNISWRQLRDLGFIQGKPFEMDGRMFMVRLPHLEVKPPADAVPIEGIRAWGQETFIEFSNGKPIQQCPVCGLAAHSWGSAHPAERTMDLGFVPVIDAGI